MKIDNPKAVSFKVKELVERGARDIPNELISNEHLIYSSPATLSYNSPGALGFGVKRAGLVIPESVMLLVAPGCCGRNTTVLGDESGYANRMFYLLMSENDLVTGKHLNKIPKAVKEICDSLEKKPKIVEICITCVDALLGTDMDRICKKAQKEADVKVIHCYMYALTREGRKPPMVFVRSMIYSLLEPAKKDPRCVNILGNFTPLADDCEFYDLLKEAGIKQINEISRFKNFDEYNELAKANFNIVLHKETNLAAKQMMDKLKIPFIELTRLYQLAKIRNQYRLFFKAIDCEVDDEKYYDKAKETLQKFKENYKNLTFAIGEMINANPFELALALSQYGFKVKAVFANLSKDDYIYLNELEKISPDTRVFTNLSPTMLNFKVEEEVDITLGKDASYYYKDALNVAFNHESIPFGYMGLISLLKEIMHVVDTKKSLGDEFQIKYPVLSQYKMKKDAYKSETKGLWKKLSPFAPDQSGASSVYYEFGGTSVIIDAGGCVGNVCGFDEPRWFIKKSTIFSAGLRDIDAIMGRDEKLLEKVEDNLNTNGGEFVALVGTPVPAVIGTDFKGLKRIGEKRLNIPFVGAFTNGVEYYDIGAYKAYESLIDTFTDKNEEGSKKDIIGIFGATPLDMPTLETACNFKKKVEEFGLGKAYVYGYGDGLEALKKASYARVNIAVSVSGFLACKYMQKKFNIPFVTSCAYDKKSFERLYKSLKNIFENKEESIDEAVTYGDKKALLLHQQVFANEIRKNLYDSGKYKKIDVCGYFKMADTLLCQGDKRLVEEYEFWDMVKEGEYNEIYADPLFKKLIPDFEGKFISLPHYSVSGHMHEIKTDSEYFKEIMTE
ncbi:nitrogenase molybdenum-cofactor synthesis protein NifE [Acetitomaculum ruminis DSM 5522]|uniref:Nitrogenase molybdenum-cofactor synthesis protein NifE n=1 Tax=Acetitomaculum ruminis DSM 5522 TaxID=1120918 RepID=A0A1I0Z6T8_9FIRM|nr:nitrogenase component 1 [Acetitomaculum ruminis]SFB21261.1 nitrogenase molybdenum-cofactor synthesis protein NifE [Acetitomaculum ruminis DSM 5522]